MNAHTADDGLQKLSLGQPYPGQLPAGEGMVFQPGGYNGPDILICAPRLSARETADLRNAPIRAGFRVENEVLLYLFKFGSSMTFDGANHAIFERDGGLPIPVKKDWYLENESGRLLLSMAAVDAVSGLVVALRSFTLSPAQTRILVTAIHDQYHTTTSREEIDRRVAELTAKPPAWFEAKITCGRCGVNP